MQITDNGMDASTRMTVQVGLVPNRESNHIPPKTAPSKIATVRHPTEPVMLISAVLNISLRDLGLDFSDRLTLRHYNRFRLSSPAAKMPRYA